MENLDPFDIVFVTCDRRRKTGGELIALRGAVKTGNGQKLQPSVPSAEVAKQPQGSPEKAVKNPDHYANSTRNLTIPGTGEVRKVHIRLITEFNGKAVIW